MAKISFTKDQQAAIDAPHGNILVSAAAGSGKTAVLTERVIRLLTGENPISADRLVIVTFTVLAAVEMRQRIEKRLTAMIQEHPENDLLQTQSLMLSSAKISTIHALCNELVKNNFQSLGLPANYRLADETELSDIKRDVLETLLEECYEAGEPAFRSLADTLSGKSDDKLTEYISGIYEFIRSYPFPMGYLDRFQALYQTEKPFLETGWGKEIRRYAGDALIRADKLMAWVMEQVDADEQLKSKYAEPMDNDRHTIRMLLTALEESDWDRACSIAHTHEKMRLGAVRGYEDKAFLEQVKSRRDEAVKIIQSLRDRCFITTQQELSEDFGFLSKHTDTLFHLVRKYDTALQEAKLEKSVIDFSDLEHYALQLLVEEKDGEYQKTKIALQINGQYDEIMIDECQDNNSIQSLIFWAMSKGAESVAVSTDGLLTASENLFLVGDVKQSIYRFRNAMPALFIRRKHLFPEQPEEGGHCRKILLRNNFRSRAEVTDSINRVFSRIMNESVGEVLYDDEEALVASASYEPHVGCQTELHCLSTDTAEPEGDEENGDQSLCEAEYVSALIEQMVQEGYPVQENGQFRPCRYRDFCILLRAKKTKTERYVNKLREHNIPCYANQTNGYFDSFEIAVMLNLLRVIDNPLLDVSLFSVLISPMFLFTPDELVEIRLQNRTAPLYTALTLQAGQGDAKCREFLETLSYLREQAVILPISRLIQLIYDQTGFLFVVESMASGEQKRANLRLLLTYAESYEGTGYRGLDGFIRYIDRAVERGEDFSCANTVSETADVVRIMTIHNSKGLEYPICIVADLAKQFNLQDLRSTFLLHSEYGFGMKIRRPETLQEYTNLPLEAVRMAVKRETLSEEMRILYVAMTRAREKLILVGSGKNLRKSMRRVTDTVAFDGEVSAYHLLELNSYLSWITAALSDEPELLCALNGEKDTVTAGGIRCTFADVTADARAAEEEIAFHAVPDEEIIRQLEESVSFVYPYEELGRLPAKVTVTQIAKSKQEMRVTEAQEITLSTSETITGAQRGTILHSFMQYADFHTAREDLDSEIARLQEQEFLTAFEAEHLNRKKIKAFLSSALLGRMLAAQAVYREYQFIYEIDAQEVDAGVSEPYRNEKILMQGIADAVIEEPDGLVIVDYKTDRLGQASEFAEKYYDQLRIYKEAVGAYFEKPVKECLIYSLYLEQEILVC